MPQDRTHRRKRSRSFSPVASKHKRSWQNNEPSRPARSPPRGPSPSRPSKKQSSYKPGFPGRRSPSPQQKQSSYKPGFPGRRSPSPQQKQSSYKPGFSGRRSQSPQQKQSSYKPGFPGRRSPSPQQKQSSYKPSFAGRRSPSPQQKQSSYKPSFAGSRRSPSPLSRKRPMSRSPGTGRRAPLSPGPRPMRDAPPPRRDSRSNLPAVRPGPAEARQRSLSPRPAKKTGQDRPKSDNFYPKRLPSPEGRFSTKKKPRMSSTSPPPPSHHHSSSAKSSSSKRRPSGSGTRRSPSPPPRPSTSGPSSRGDNLPERKVTSASKKKWPRPTLHKRFTTEDQEPFRLEDNVTIAILRNPNAEPSEEVTVKRVFDSSMFKMIHKKTAGRRPIFDREEIKVWRHDENLADDPDFERRLVRVKSSTQTSGKPASDSLSRMSPDVIRKAFGLQVGARSKSRSPHREPQIRLDPRPDPRYESKYRQQVEKEERRRSGVDKSDRRGGGGRAGSLERDRNTYDLREALERRRSDREDGGFRVEVRHDEGRKFDSHYRPEPRNRSPEFGRPQFGDGGGDSGGRNVVFGRGGGGNHGGDRYDNLSPERDGMGKSWEVDRGGRSRGRFRGRGRGRGNRGRQDWSPDMRSQDDFRGRSPERRPRYSTSPSNSRGWRGNRGGRGRGRGRDFNSPYHAEIVSPTEIDDSFKYTQHDDRDVSPKQFRGRGRGRGRGRFPARSFGSNNFRGTRGGYRGRIFRGKNLNYVRDRDERSPDRSRDRSADREWKHDMYDSLQTEEEQPHSTTMST